MTQRVLGNSVTDRVEQALSLVLIAQGVLKPTGEYQSHELDRAMYRLEIVQEHLNAALQEINDSSGML